MTLTQRGASELSQPREAATAGALIPEAALTRLVSCQLLARRQEGQRKKRESFTETTLAKIVAPQKALALADDAPAEQAATTIS